MYQMRLLDGSPGPCNIHSHDVLPIKTSTWLYLRVVKLETNLSRRLRERPVSFEHSFSYWEEASGPSLCKFSTTP